MNRILASMLLILGSWLTVAEVDQKTELLYDKGIEKNAAGLFIEASVLFTEAIAANDQQHRFFHQRGLSFFGMGQEHHGIKDLKRAADLGSDALAVYLKLIEHYRENSQFMLILILTDQMMIHVPKQKAGAYYDKGKAYEALNKPQMAIKAYQTSIKELGSTQPGFKKMLAERINYLRLQEKTP